MSTTLRTIDQEYQIKTNVEKSLIIENGLLMEIKIYKDKDIVFFILESIYPPNWYDKLRGIKTMELKAKLKYQELMEKAFKHIEEAKKQDEILASIKKALSIGG